MRSVARGASLLHNGQERVRDQCEALEVGLRGTARLLEVREEVAEPSAHRRALEPGRDERLEQRLRRLVLLLHIGERRLEDVGRLGRAARDEVQHRRPVLRTQARRPAGLPPPAPGARRRRGRRRGRPRGPARTGSRRARRPRGARPRPAPGSARRPRGRPAPPRAAPRAAAPRAPSRPGPARTPAGALPRQRGRPRAPRASARPARGRASAPRRACRPRSRPAGSGA